MNTICKIPDIDIYLLKFLDIKTIMTLTRISRDQYELLSIDFINELRSVKENLISGTLDILLYGFLAY